MKELHKVKIYHVKVKILAYKIMLKAGQSNGHKSVDASTLKDYVTQRCRSYYVGFVKIELGFCKQGKVGDFAFILTPF